MLWQQCPVWKALDIIALGYLFTRMLISSSRLLTSRGIVGNASKLRIPEETPTQECIVTRLTETVAEKERNTYIQRIEFELGVKERVAEKDRESDAYVQRREFESEI